MLNFKKISVLVAGCYLLLPLISQAAVFPAPGTPTLLAPVAGYSTVIKQPVVTGLTQNQTQVAVYIDNVYNGQATVKNGAASTASFAYQPYLPLTTGWHTVKVKAQDARTGLESATTLVRSFYVASPLPAPTVFTPVVNSATTWDKPWIVGLSTNQTTLLVYLDGVYNGSIAVRDHASLTGDFAYHPFLALTPGTHTVSVIAVDSAGKKSSPSGLKQFIVERPIAAASAAVTESASSAPVSDSSSGLKNSEQNISDSQTQPSSVEESTQPSQSSTSSTSQNNWPVNQSTIGWLLLIAIAIALVLRNRHGLKKYWAEPNPAADPFKPSVPEPKSVEVIKPESKDQNLPSAGK